MSTASPSDAFKLMRMIYTVAKNAKVHRETCAEFAAYVTIINNLLTPIERSPQVIQLPPVQDALAMLHKNLVKGYLLLQKCEHTSTISAMMKHVPRQLKELEGEIQKILSLLNLANLHVNLGITTNGTNQELNKGGISSYPDVYTPTLGVSTSLQDTPGQYSDIMTRSISVPSTSTQGLATSQCLSAKSLAITWGNDERYWKWVERKGSRSNEVAYLVDVYWLEVQGQVSLSTLRPGKYTLSWRLQLACLDNEDKRSGWDSEPVIFKLSTTDRQQTERSCFLVEEGPGKLETPLDLKTSVVQNGSEEEFTDGWKEYEVGTFMVKKKRKPVELIFSLTEANGSWKRGLFIDSVVISPCDGLNYDLLLSEVTSTPMEVQEELPTLPAVVTFSGHHHDLKLMTDSYWFACGICEATEQGLGYNCQQCQYNVHPECCISEHQFATLLDLTDSNFSHWHWNNLLELHKHRIEEKSARPKAVIFAGHPHLLKLAQNPYPSFICDARECDGQGWVYRGWDGWIYRCEGCDFDIHPECRI
ncbi:unnamed protein product [Calypogeia fissa]